MECRVPRRTVGSDESILRAPPVSEASSSSAWGWLQKAKAKLYPLLVSTQKTTKRKRKKRRIKKEEERIERKEKEITCPLFFRVVAETSFVFPVLPCLCSDSSTAIPSRPFSTIPLCSSLPCFDLSRYFFFFFLFFLFFFVFEF